MWMPLDFIAEALDGDGHVEHVDTQKFDLNGDGHITASDCPFIPGSAEAKLWYRNILEPTLSQNITPEMQAKYGAKVVGTYLGKPLVPGDAGPGQGDFQLLVDKIQVTQGLSYQSAVKIAGKIKLMKFGG